MGEGRNVGRGAKEEGGVVGGGGGGGGGGTEQQHTGKRREVYEWSCEVGRKPRSSKDETDFSGENNVV